MITACYARTEFDLARILPDPLRRAKFHSRRRASQHDPAGHVAAHREARRAAWHTTGRARRAGLHADRSWREDAGAGPVSLARRTRLPRQSRGWRCRQRQDGPSLFGQLRDARLSRPDRLDDIGPRPDGRSRRCSRRPDRGGRAIRRFRSRCRVRRTTSSQAQRGAAVRRAPRSHPPAGLGGPLSDFPGPASAWFHPAPRRHALRRPRAKREFRERLSRPRGTTHSEWGQPDRPDPRPGRGRTGLHCPSSQRHSCISGPSSTGHRRAPRTQHARASPH